MNPDNIIFLFIRFYPCAKFISQIYSIRRSTELARDIRAIVVRWDEAEVEEVVKLLEQKQLA